MAEGPGVILERLHKELAAANAEAEALLAQWGVVRSDGDLLERYNVAQVRALTIGRQIAEHIETHGL